MPAIKPNALRTRMESDPSLVIVDVREPGEFGRATLPGARNVPLDEDAPTRLAAEIGDRSRPVVFVCTWGHRSAVASIALKREGFRDVSYLDGGLEAWGYAALPVVRSSGPGELRAD